MSKMTAVWAAVVVVLFSISAVVLLEIASRPLDNTVALLSAVAVPTVLTLLNLARTEHVAVEVQKVKDQTNGHITALHERMNEQDGRLDQLADPR